MSVQVSFNGQTYTLPTAGEKGWAAALTSFLQAVAANALTTVVTLVAEMDLGATYGIRAKWFRSQTTNPAAAGVGRLARADTISWRNQASDADLPLGVDSSNNLEFNSVDILTATGTQTVSGKTFTTFAAATADISGTPGAGTVNATSGVFAVAIGAASVTIQNSLVTSSSKVFCQIQFTDATLLYTKSVVAGSGSFTFTGNATATAATKVCFWVIN